MSAHVPPRIPRTGPVARGRLSLGTSVAVLALTATACSDGLAGPASLAPDCSIPLAEFTDGGTRRSEIPSLSNPKVGLRFSPDVAYLTLADRVIGIQFNGQPLAIPHKILWWHEVVNLAVPGQERTVTYSPLTGSSLFFDRTMPAVSEFTVSTYVLDTNLVMEDETGTLWPQMRTAATCGPRNGVALQRLPYQEMTFGAWLSLHPDTWTVSSGTGFDFLYTLYPYGDYRAPDNPELLYPISSPVDTRRPPKERVLGIPDGEGGGIAFPLSTLAQVAAADQGSSSPAVQVWAESARVGGAPVVVFFNSLAAGAVAYRAEADGQELTFEVRDGARTDVQTGSLWDFEGNAFVGPLEGARLQPIADAYTAFWFAWAEFQPETEVWTAPIVFSATPDFEPLRLPPEPIDWDLARR